MLPITVPVVSFPHPLGHSTLNTLPVGPTKSLSSPVVSQTMGIPVLSTGCAFLSFPSSGNPSSTVAPGP